MYFKAAGRISAPSADGRSHGEFAAMNYLGVPPGETQLLPNFTQLADFREASTFYSEYKMLAVKLTLFAINVGTEAMKGSTAIPQATGWLRGNTALYAISDRERNQTLPTDIQDVITKGSCQIIPSRAERWRRTLYRPKNYVEWGCCDNHVPAANRTPDPWFGQLVLLGNDATPGKPLWYWQLSTKVIFRGRTLTSL